MPRVASDFYQSKAFILAVIATVAIGVWAMVFQHRPVSEGETQTLTGLWMAVFIRDTMRKNHEETVELAVNAQVPPFVPTPDEITGNRP